MTRRNALSFWNGPDGPVVRWKCNCGHEGFLDQHGSHADDVNVECESAPAHTAASQAGPTDRTRVA